LWDEELIKGLYQPIFAGDPCEGYVVRISDSFIYKDFRNVVAKWVRENHVTTDEHWKNQIVEANGLRK
jgi:hypothetical protein